MSKNIHQIFVENPITTNDATDLMYFGQSPYGATDDAAMTFQDFADQFSGSGVTEQQVQQLAFNVGVESGTGTAYVVTLNPSIAAYTDGMLLSFVPTHANTSITPTVNVNGRGARQIIINQNDSSLNLGDLNENILCTLQYSASGGGVFILLNPQLSLSVSRDVLTGTNYWTGSDQGMSANDYEVTIPFSTSSGANEFNPIFVVMQSANATNTGASTLTITGVGSPWDIVNSDNTALVAGQIVSGQCYLFFFNSSGTNYQLVNASGSTSLASIVQVQRQGYNYGVDSGSDTAYAVALTPAIASYTDGLLVAFIPDNTNTSNLPTLNVNGLGAVPIRVGLDFVVAIGDINVSRVSYFIYSSGSGGIFYLLNPQLSAVHGLDLLTGSGFWTGADVGVAANDYSLAIDFSERYTLLPYPPLFVQMITANATNTGASNLEIVNVGTYPILLDANGAALVGGEIVQFNTYFMVYSSDIQAYILMNSSLIQMQSMPLITTPGVGSQSSSLTLGAAFQNPFGYDVVLTVYLAVTAATAANITLGVGSTNSPTPQTIVAGYTIAALSIIPVTIYIPKNYYALLDTSGTITLTISGQHAMPV